MKCIPIIANSSPLFVKVSSNGDVSSESVGLNYLNRASGFLKISFGPTNPFIALCTDNIAASVLKAALAPLLSLNYLPALIALQGI